MPHTSPTFLYIYIKTSLDHTNCMAKYTFTSGSYGACPWCLALPHGTGITSSLWALRHDAEHCLTTAALALPHGAGHYTRLDRPHQTFCWSAGPRLKGRSYGQVFRFKWANASQSRAVLWWITDFTLERHTFWPSCPNPLKTSMR